MNLFTDPELSRKAAKAVQGMPFELRERFIATLEQAKSIDDLPRTYRSYLNNGYKPDKVMDTK
jgi:hypothetical protein